MDHTIAYFNKVCQILLKLNFAEENQSEVKMRKLLAFQ